MMKWRKMKSDFFARVNLFRLSSSFVFMLDGLQQGSLVSSKTRFKVDDQEKKYIFERKILITFNINFE